MYFWCSDKRRKNEARLRSCAAGFTLIEILFVIAIMALLAALLGFGFSDFAYRQSFTQIVEEVTLDLAAQRQKSIASESDTTHGMYVSSTSVVYFSGAAYASTSPTNRMYDLPDYMSATSSLGSGVSEVVFARLTGEASVSGTISLVDHRTIATSTITVTSAGLIE